MGADRVQGSGGGSGGGACRDGPTGPGGGRPGSGLPFRPHGQQIAGDVRTLARDFCAAGTPVDYTQYDALVHITTSAAWTPAALAWLSSRFGGTLAPDDCSQIPPGNSLAPCNP